MELAWINDDILSAIEIIEKILDREHKVRQHQ